MALFIVVLALASVALAQWNEKVLFGFQGFPDGATPAGGAVFDTTGNLYGATQTGGSEGNGGVFKLSPPAQKGGAWTETLLYSFLGNLKNDGEWPSGGLVIDGSGNLYGVTAYGGTGGCQLLGIPMGCGVVYEISPPGEKEGQWTETILHSFQSGSDGYLPNGNLVLGSAGNLYGATAYGGGYGSCNAPYYQYCGTVFELSPPTTKGGHWAEKVLYSFKGVADGKNSGDGANPNGGLVLDKTGSIYGTTNFGGNNLKGQCLGGAGGTGCGIVFALEPPTKKGGRWTEKLVHRFNGQDGSNSAAGVVFDGNGNLYGTTSAGPQNGFGLVFELRKPSERVHYWMETVLCLFNNGSNGAYPIAGLVFDAKGDLYGTATGGDQSPGGNVFQLKPPSRKGGSWPLKILHGFLGSPDGAHPTAGLVLDKTGNLYGTTQWGGSGQSCQGGCGTVFEVSP